ncbi:hypothetical protein LSCM1_07584 [Leishmania martiniquensis]|uniref:PH domain-containing protein n=1 Tax=Leishmania martiniquensis TaxID=1580590 RepID=A0A836H668_9TRYP|nr:hypothetical protein LSCM1_07584 [Leishmania martiniquensis]
MNSLQTSAADAAVVCLRVLRRLLQDEEVAQAQLSYLIENVHDPLAQACLPPSQRPVVIAAPQLSSLSASVQNRFSSFSRHAHSAVPSPMAAAATTAETSRRVPPQPAVVAAAALAQQQTLIRTAESTGRTHKTAESASKKGAVCDKSPSSSTGGSAPRAPLTFSQYWDIFANLPTLYMVHLTLVQQLDAILQRLSHIVEELQPATLDTTNGAPATAPASDATLNAHLHTRKHVTAMRNSSAGAVAGARNVSNEIGVMVCEFFGSELMKHFMAEHMMYAIKYTQRAAPQLLHLSRLWRWSAESSASSGVSAASLAHLSEVDQKTILQNGLFFDFLWRSFGPSGIPADSRVCISASPELKQSTKAGGQCQWAPPTEALAGGGIGGARRSRPGQAASSPATRLPPIPAMWEGFRTLLMLLATPLSILRRYSHVARCLVESGALLPKDRDRLQSGFVDIAALRISEETNLVMEELCLHDVTGIMALMDIPGASTNTGGAIALADSEPTHNGAAAAPASAGAPVSYSSRVLIHYGRLMKRYGRGRHERLTFLFSDWMCYAEESSNGRFRVRGTIPLSGLRVIEVYDDPSSDTVNCFELILPSLPKRIIFYAASPEQRGQWVNAIRYTVRQFSEGQRHKQAVANGVARSSNANATTKEGSILSVMRPTAPMLASNSRLRRQRRYDGMWQEHRDLEQRKGEMTLLPPNMLPAAGGASSPTAAAGPVGGSSSFALCHSPPPANVSSGDPSRDGSFVHQRSSSSHRHLDYDVTPWSQRASVHRRIRSQDLIAAHQQQLAASSSSLIATPTQPCETPPGGGGAAAGSCSDVHRIVVDAGDMGNPSPVGTADMGAPSQQPHSHQLLSPITSAPAMPSATGRRGSGSGFSTPLRRPVSERFEAVKLNSSAGSLSQHPQHQRTGSASLRSSLAGTLEHQQWPAPLSHAENAASHLISSHAAPLPPTATSSSSSSGDGGADVPLLSPEVHHNAPAEDDELVPENCTTEVSEPMEGEDQLLSLASPHAAAAVPPSLCNELLGLDPHLFKESSHSTSSSGALESIVDDSVVSPTAHGDGMQTSNAPPLGTAGAQQRHGATLGPLHDSSVSIQVPSTPALVVGGEDSHEARPAAALDHHASATATTMSFALPLGHSADDGIEEEDSATPTAAVTAFRFSGPTHHRLMMPASPVVMECRSAAVSQETGNAPMPFRMFSDLSSDADAVLQKLKAATEPQSTTLARRHVDPTAGEPHGEHSEDGSV